MAYRQLVRRVWASPVRDIRCFPISTSPFASACAQPCAPSRPARSVSLVLSRSLSLTSHRRVSFNVQDKEDFTERVINNDLPVLVDFHAHWCGPCKILGPRLEKAIAKQPGLVTMAKVSAVPTVIAMQGGHVIDRFVGIQDEDQLDSFVGKLIGQ